MRFLVTGTGRSGTGYVAKTLAEFFGEPVGHEGVFTPRGPVNPSGYLGDSSWLAVPYLSEVKIPVVHVVRDYREVAKSMRGIGFFLHSDAHGEYARFALNTCPGIESIPIEDREAWFIWMWNSLIDPYITLRFRLEEFNAGDGEMIARAIGWRGSVDYRAFLEDKVPKNYNTRPRAEEFTIKTEPYRSLLDKQSRVYGYGLQDSEG